ncbi:MAG: N-acetylmuramoyl-L-alanine amidase, partial [Frankiales bacterium]|nr:N-acetylmuramoyl-L-alanine amidase [Frankiales bacterium]
TDVRTVTVTAGTRDVTGSFRKAGPGLRGLVTRLPGGRSTLKAVVPGAGSATLAVSNVGLQAPSFSGPLIQPWTCSNGATRADCSKNTTISYVYKSTDPSKAGTPGRVASDPVASPFQPYDPANPPSDVATTTTDDGHTVPFVVRVEEGYSLRDQYRIAALFDPATQGRTPDPLAANPGFNHKLVLTHGASCDTEYQSGAAPDTKNVAALGAGFVVASHALDNAGHNCNLSVQAEALYMTKERVIEQYGTLRYTIGSGCSGGSLVQQQVANAYPGMYQGISPQCSFTDAWSSAQQYVDYVMLLAYFKDPSRWTPGVVWDPVAISEVLGHPNVANPVTFTTAIPNSSDPSRSCPGVPADKVYDPAKNPKGVKCTLQDYSVNMFGKRPDGFANRGLGNVGIQYGLAGLRNGLISPAQFADLNAHLGGIDIKGEISPTRLTGDALGLQRVYSTGAVDSANNLDKVAIIDLRGPDPGAFHDVYRTYVLRNRLLRNFGTAANQVLWRGQVPLLGDANYVDQAIFALDKWLDRVSKDSSARPLAKKIIADKPSAIAERCTDGAGQSVPSEVCDQTVAAYASPRIAAGGPVADDVMQCQLKPLRRDDFNAAFTDAQWAELKKAFGKGVCDYSKPGVAQKGATAWLTYQDSRGRVVYGGTPMGAVPVSTPFS